MAFTIKTFGESGAGNLVLKCAPLLGGELCKLGLWRAEAARLNCVQQQEEEEEEETKPNKFHLVVQNIEAGASAAAAADLHP